MAGLLKPITDNVVALEAIANDGKIVAEKVNNGETITYGDATTAASQ